MDTEGLRRLQSVTWTSVQCLLVCLSFHLDDKHHTVINVREVTKTNSRIKEVTTHTQTHHILSYDLWSVFYLSSVVHHEVCASHSVGALGWRDPKVVTAGVPHGKDTKCVPTLICDNTQAHLKEVNKYCKHKTTS